MSDDARQGLATIAVDLAAFGALVLATVWLDRAFPPDGSGVEQLRIVASVRQWLHSLATLALGVAGLVAVDMVLLPWLDLHAAVQGTGAWSAIPLAMRCTAVAGWCVLAAAILLSMTQGVIAL